MRFKREVIEVAEAQKRISAHMIVGGIEEVPLEQSFARRLAASLYAGHDIPHFQRAEMDGYAVRAKDTQGASADAPAKFEVIETIPCGFVPLKRVTSGQAARIMTGSVVPEGADVVIMLEMCESSDEAGQPHIQIKQEMAEGTNITDIGFEVNSGELLLEKGCPIRPGETALLATFGYSTVKVFKQPIVAIIATGSELLPVEAPLQPGKIRNSNGYMLAAQVREAGGVPILMETISDDVELAKLEIEAAFTKADMVITTGGVSVGDYDILVDLFEQWEGTMLFNKVAMRPGSPTTVGVWNDKFLFSLSGNPSACFVGFELFVRPVLQGMQGMQGMDGQTILPSALLAVDYAKGSLFTRYVRGHRYVMDARLYVRPAGWDKSSVISSIKDANCLIVIPPRESGLQQGELVSLIMLDGKDEGE